MKKKNQHRMKVVRTGEEHAIEHLPFTSKAAAQAVGREDLPDDECRLVLDARCQSNLDATGNPFHHKAADGTVVTPDPAISYLLSRIPMDDQEYIMQMWQQYIRPGALPAVPVDKDWYKKHPITRADLDGSSGRFV